MVALGRCSPLLAWRETGLQDIKRKSIEIKLINSTSGGGEWFGMAKAQFPPGPFDVGVEFRWQECCKQCVLTISLVMPKAAHSRLAYRAALSVLHGCSMAMLCIHGAVDSRAKMAPRKARCPHGNLAPNSSILDATEGQLARSPLLRASRWVSAIFWLISKREWCGFGIHVWARVSGGYFRTGWAILAGVLSYHIYG